MNDTRRRKRRLRLGPASCAVAAASAMLSVNLVEGFCPVPTVHVQQLPTQSISANNHHRCPWLTLSSSNSNHENDDGEDSVEETSNILLHQEIQKADPDWYQEYVSDLLGDDYCKNRWLAMEVSTPEKVDLEEEIESTETTEEQLEESTNDERETDTISEEAIESEETNEILSTNENVDENENEAEEEDQSNGDEMLAEQTEIIDDKTTDPLATNETRALVYRSITGKKMTCVPLAEILELGYSLSDLERIQAEFLSIVVLDQRKCPSMGVPSQWKLKDPKAQPEVTFLDSMEEAQTMVNEINEQERVEKESVQQRRQRQEDRHPESAPRERNSTSRSSRREKREIYDPRSKRRNNKENQISKSRQANRERERKRRRKENEAPPERRRRERLDRDGNPRKIYRVPRDDTRSRAPKADDPPDPESPVWINMDQFRDLLQKEAEFRMKFIGEDWSQVIEQENDWREELYKGWLWNLKNGIGESFVPPSRYERARRNQQKFQSSQTRRSPKDTPPRRRRTEDERRELRRRGKRPPPPQQQQRRKREPEDDPDNVPSNASERRSRRERRRGPPEDDR